jgi:phosphoglycerol transferase MdoB-like AlkP superfamily enzyme
MRKKIPFFVVPLIFIVFNLLTPFLLTTRMNELFLNYNISLVETLFSILGDLAIILIVVLLISQIKNTTIQISLYAIISFVFATLLLLVNYFNFYFVASPNLENLNMMRNPTSGYSTDIFIQLFRFMVSHTISLAFIPFFLIIIVLIFGVKESHIHFFLQKIKGIVVTVLLIFSFIFISFFSFSSNMKKYNLTNNTLPNYGILELGAYNYYFFELLHSIPNMDLEESLGIESDEDVFELIDKYNKNKNSYSGLDNLTYSNVFTTNDILSDITVSWSLKNTNKPLFEGKNLVLVQLESFNNFLLENKNIRTKMPFLNAIFNESLVFDNFYTSIGVGTSSDTELAVLTGLYPLGSISFSLTDWINDASFSTLPKLFHNKNYSSVSSHGDLDTFYNRGDVFENIFGFDSFYSIDDFLEDYDLDYDKLTNKYSFEYETGKFHTSPWVSDYLLFDDVVNKANNYKKSNTNFFIYPITLMPHTPFNFNPIPVEFEEYHNADFLTREYISFATYYDETIKRLFLDENNNLRTLENTVYLFYGDHGSSLKDNGIDLLFEKSLSPLEKRDIIQKVACFMYVPNVSVSSLKYYNGIKIYEGLVKGKQELVRSTVDIYRTIIDLFGLPIGNYPYFGVNMLGKERTYALENRYLDVVTDFYVYNLINRDTFFFDLEENTKVDEKQMREIYLFKLLCEYLLMHPEYLNSLNSN